MWTPDAVRSGSFMVTEASLVLNQREVPNVSASVPSGHDELFFDSLIRGYVEENRRFVRRDWLAQELEAKLAEPSKHFVLLAASPGAGKSAFMAQLAQDHSEWLRYFIRRDQRSVMADVSARSLLLRIGYQFAARQPELFSEEQLRLSVSVEQHVGTVANRAEAIGVEVKRLRDSPFRQKVLTVVQHVQSNQGRVIGLKIGELVLEPRLLTVEDLLFLSLVAPARALARIDPARQIVILIDALDEVRYHQEPENILAWLTNCPGELPQNVRFVLTSRPPDETTVLFCEKQKSCLTRLTISEEDPRVQADTGQFVATLISEVPLAQELRHLEVGADEFAKKAVERAHGNLGYLDALARGIDQALARKQSESLHALLGLKELPADLEGLYDFFLHQIKAAVAREWIEVEDPETGATHDQRVWPAVYHRVLGVLAVAMEPLTLELIVRLGHIRTELISVSDALDRLVQFLDVIDGRYRLYHATVAEFLTDAKTRKTLNTRDLYQDAARLNAAIVRTIRGGSRSWSSVDWSAVEEYGLVHVLSHLLAVGGDGRGRRAAYELICEPFMREKYRRLGSHASFAQDVERLFHFARRHQDVIEMVLLLVCRGNLTDIGRDVPESLIAALVLLKQRARAEACAVLIEDPHRRVRAYLAIAAAERQLGHLGDAMRAYGHAVDATNSQDISEHALIEVGNALLDAGAVSEALRIARLAATRMETITAVGAELAAPKAALLLGRSGAPAEALALLSKLTDARDPALNLLAIELARVGDYCFALVAVQEIFVEQQREAALNAVADVVAADASTLIARADRIESTQQRSQALSALASIVARTDRVVAHSVAESAFALASSLGNDHRAAEAISKAVEPIALLGDHERALKVGRGIQYQLHRSRALRAVVRALISKGSLDLAEVIAAEISEDDRRPAVLELLFALLADRKWERALAVTKLVTPYERHEALTLLSDGLLDAGETERAVQAARLAFQSASENGFQEAAADALCAEARAHMRVGDIESALGAAGRVSVQQDVDAPLLERLGAWLAGVQDRLRVITEIAFAEADAGRPDAAIRLLTLTEAPAGTSDAFRAIAERLLERGHVAEALDFAERVLKVAPNLEHEPSQAAQMTPWIVALLGRADRWERATEVARAAGDDYTADAVLKHRVSQKITEGRFDDALQLAAEIASGSTRCEAQASVARGLAEAASWERAIKIASELECDSNSYIVRFAAVSDIILKLATAGLADQGLTLATDLLIVPQKRVRYFTAVSLVEMAEALASAGKSEGCVAVLERALRVAKANSPAHNLAYQVTRVAVGFAIAGKPQRALEAIDGLPNAHDRMEALNAAAERLEQMRVYKISLELCERAVALAEEANDAFNYAAAQGHAAVALAWSGDIDGALGMIARIENSYKQGLAISAAARPIVEAGRVEDLKEIIGQTKEGFDRRQALRVVAVALAEAEVGHSSSPSTDRGLLGKEDASADVGLGSAKSDAEMQDEAMENLERAAVMAYGDDARLARVAIRFARAKRFERALDLFRAIEGWTNGPEGTDGALAQMAPYFAEARVVGDLLSSLESRISSPQTLGAVIKALVATNHVDAALQGWRFVVERSVGRNSGYILDVVAAGATALAQTDGGATLSEMCDAMFAVDDWWERPMQRGRMGLK